MQISWVPIRLVFAVLFAGAALPADATLAPSVSLTSPPNNTFLSEGDTIRLQALASDPDGTVLKVEFYVEGVLAGEVAPAPFVLDWSTPLAGA